MSISALVEADSLAQTYTNPGCSPSATGTTTFTGPASREGIIRQGRSDCSAIFWHGRIAASASALLERVR